MWGYSLRVPRLEKLAQRLKLQNEGLEPVDPATRKFDYEMLSDDKQTRPYSYLYGVLGNESVTVY